MISSTMMALIDRLAADGRISDAEAVDVRRAVFPDGAVSREEAEALFALNERVGGDDPAWNACFVEAICDHLLNSEPFGHVTDEGAAWLLASIGHDGVLEGPTELELALKLLEKAESCPRALHDAARKFVSAAVLSGQGYEGRDAALVPGQIGEVELSLIRRMLFAAGGAGNVSVTREEAEWLFELDAATQGQSHVAGWRDLFVSGVMNHLFAVGPSALLDRSGMMQRAQWVGAAHKGGIGGFLSRVVTGGAAGFTERANQPNAIDGQSTYLRSRETEATIAEALETREADWLMQCINADGRRTANEQALVDAVKAAKGEAALKSA
jgi:hypothetical protein